METLPALETFQTRDEWLEARRVAGIGSSDAPAILGLSRYKSSYQLYQEKLGLMPTSKNENEQIQWGNILEEPIAQRYALETKRAVTNPNVDEAGQKIFRLIRSSTEPWMVAQVDRFTAPATPEEAERYGARVGVLEIKNAHFFTGKEWLDTQEPPLEFIVQVQHQLAVTGYQWASVAALIGGCRFVYADIRRDDEFIRMLMQQEQAFWERLLRREAPEPDGSERTAEAIARLYQEKNATIVAVPPDYIEKHVELAQVKDQIKLLETRKREIENTFKATIADAAGLRMPNGVVYTWKTQTRKEFITKASTFRVLRAFEPRRPELPAGTVAPLALPDGLDSE